MNFLTTFVIVTVFIIILRYVFVGVLSEIYCYLRKGNYGKLYPLTPDVKRKIRIIALVLASLLAWYLRRKGYLGIYPEHPKEVVDVLMGRL